MNIAIYDTEHFETTYALIKILNTPANKITLFTKAETASVIKTLLKKDAENVNIQIRAGGRVSFIITLFRFCLKDNISHLFLNTISYHHLFFGLLSFLVRRRTVTVLTIHAANSFFKPKWNIRLRGIAHNAGRWLLQKTVTHYSVLLCATKQYIVDNYQPRQIVNTIPGGLYMGETVLKEFEGTLKIVIPGSVDRLRRNYEQIFDLAKSLEIASQQVQIVLLGGAAGSHGQEIVNKAKAFSGKTVFFKVYETAFVEQEEFDNQLSLSHFIFLPIPYVITKTNEADEIYGLTQCSGGFFDAIRHGKPLLLPCHTFISPELAQQCIQYKSMNELSGFLCKLNEHAYNKYAGNALANAEKFSLSSVRASVFKQVGF